MAPAVTSLIVIGPALIHPSLEQPSSDLHRTAALFLSHCCYPTPKHQPMTITTEFIENLAADIGSKVYIDIAKWHLYLNDAHLHTPLAEKLAASLEDGNISESTVKAALKSLTVTLGGGQATLPLSELVPNQCYQDLIEVLEEHQQNL